MQTLDNKIDFCTDYAEVLLPLNVKFPVNPYIFN